MANQPAKGNSKTKILIAIFVVTVAAMGGFIFLLLTRQTEPIVVVTAPTPVPNVLVGMSADEIERRIQEQEANNTGVIVSMPSYVIFKDGKAEGKIDLENVVLNTDSFTVDYQLEDGKSVLKTGLLAPGYVLQYQKLDTELSKGEYHVNAIYTTYDENGIETGIVGVATKFIVQN